MKVQGCFFITQRTFRALLALAVCMSGGIAQATTLSGYVTRTSDGTPIEGAVVRTDDSFAQSAQTTTGADGSYGLEFNCVGSCSVSATTDGYVLESRSFPSSSTSVVTNFSLAVEATIGGRLTLPPGAKATADAPGIERFDSDAGEWRSTYAALGVNGDTYIYTKLHAGIYRLCYVDLVMIRQCYDGLDQGPLVGFDYTPIEVAAGDARANVDFSPRIGSLVSGRLVDGYANTNLADLRAYISVFDENGGQMGYPQEVQTDAEGRYSIVGLAPGNYFLLASNGAFLTRIYPNGNCDAEDCDPIVQGTPVTVPQGGATNIDFALQPNAVVRARVVDAVDGTEILDATFASWVSFIWGTVPSSRHWYDASTGEYVSYNSTSGGSVGASAPGYITRFIVGGNCPDLRECASSNPPLVQPRGEVRHVQLRLTRSDDYLFSSDFE